MSLQPPGPHIKRVYKLDGSRTEEPIGYGGTLCHKATSPYDKRQGYSTSRPTDEANQPEYKLAETASETRAEA